MKLKINCNIFIFSIIVSLTITVFSYFFILSLKLSLVINIIISLVVFISSFLLILLIYNLITIYVLHKKGVKGYKLRGRITFYFLLAVFISIILIGSTILYLTYIIKNEFIDKQANIYSSALESYKNLIKDIRGKFELNIKNNISKNIDDIDAIFIISNQNVNFIKCRKKSLEYSINENKHNIIEYFSSSNLNTYYIGELSEIIIIRYNNKYYANYIPELLKNHFININEYINELNKYNLLKKYIIPITIISIILLSIPIFIIVIIISYFIAINITKNIEEIVKATNIISLGNLDYQISINSNDEIKDLANSFNIMANKLKTATQQIKRMERLEAWKEMAKKLAHEIKNPLTPIMLNAERLLYIYEYKNENFKDILEKTTQTIINETKRLENLVNEFSVFARLPYPKLEKKNIILTIEEIINFFKNAYQDFIFENEFSDNEIIVEYDENLIKQAIINIIMNSIEASTKEEKYIRITLKKLNVSVIISIEDKGIGIPIENRDKIFNPYFTTKEKGTGLGLAVSERIILEHNGYIWFETSDKGTKFFIELPFRKPGENYEL